MHFESPTTVTDVAHRPSFRSEGFARRRQDKELIAEAVQTLLQTPKRLNCKYLYDRRGSALFDQICELPEYYLTRTEQSIMRSSVSDMVRRIGRDALLVEFGSGSSLKTRLLLDQLPRPRAYLPVDISSEHLLAAADRLRSEYPQLRIEPIVGDFNHPLELPTEFAGGRVCVYFPGSTIGNLPPREAQRLLRTIANQCGRDGALLIGFDLQKDIAVLEAAYNDSQGLTAAFSLNLLHRLNREAGADFNVHQFRHLAFYNPVAERIEIYLQSRREQVVRIDGVAIPFAEGERIQTEYSHKYTVAGFSALAAEAGLVCKNVWTDHKEYFAVMFLEPENVC